ncbi:toll/interleukin-1 receptor domain-containing protein [Fictibacillus nanhaiensis]|uniref:TIR domain-containing protein n=1 Tax=Fictibacillus nanhaiensis TaxID=742169 RepID=UPI00203D7BAB|nr:TIR domain-containing protein [Fictibacillus nanhaiensis]MCM3730108.1 toll/interleukin-1 receptor domain-containing protein [Fictibacillus nanhaiensis]
MKVFLSWSGELSKDIAKVFREWLPQVIQAVEPYVSSEDIRKGNRWSSEIATELEVSNFGIVFLTPDNIEAPWINFESGALAKTVSNSNVSPFLFGLKNSDIKGPLTQFQATLYEKDEVEKLLLSINDALGERSLNETVLKKVFEVWWSSLDEELDTLRSRLGTKVEEPPKEEKNDEVLEELLELVRSQQRILNDPESVLPPKYLRSIIRKAGMPEVNHDTPHLIRDLEIIQMELQNILESTSIETFETDIQIMKKLVDRLDRPRKHLNRSIRRIPIRLKDAVGDFE